MEKTTKIKSKKSFTLITFNDGGATKSVLTATTEVGALNEVYKSKTGSDLPFGTNTYNAKKLVNEKLASGAEVSLILNGTEEAEGQPTQHWNIITA